jgi:hypothetical protein
MRRFTSNLVEDLGLPSSQGWKAYETDFKKRLIYSKKSFILVDNGPAKAYQDSVQKYG